MCGSNKTLVILGMHRSGTSLTANWIHEMGLNLGEDLLGPDSSNKKGHFEDKDFLNFHESILRKHGLHRSGLRLKEKPKIVLSKTDREKLSEIIQSKNLKSQWGFKEPRTCLFLEYYRELLPDAFYFIVFRNRKLVVDSLLARAKHSRAEKRKLDLKRGFPKNKIYPAIRLIKDTWQLRKMRKKFPKDWTIYNEMILDHIKQIDSKNYIAVDVNTIMNFDVQICNLLRINNFCIEECKLFKDVFDAELMHEPESRKIDC
jgi:hypothetical protein